MVDNAFNKVWNFGKFFVGWVVTDKHFSIGIETTVDTEVKLLIYLGIRLGYGMFAVGWMDE